MSDESAPPVRADRTVTVNPWAELRRFTRARVAPGRAGTSLPTDALLAFQLDHARAVDAVHRALDTQALGASLAASPGLRSLVTDAPVVLRSEARDRFAYLQRPDLGRLLSEADWQRLREHHAAGSQAYDLALVLADGLSAGAVQQHAVPFLEAFAAHLRSARSTWHLAPVTIVTQGRVAIGDDIGEALRARAVLLLVGERPGLTSPDSLGAYLTWAPRRGTLDSGRNCISNIRPAGLSFDAAAAKALYLLGEAFRLEQTGIGLKDRAVETEPEALPGDTAESRFRLTDGSGAGRTRV